MKYTGTPNATTNGSNGTSLMLRDLRGSCALFTQLFGQPSTGDEYKVTCEWIVTSSEGDVFTIYDWKETEMYDPDSPPAEIIRTHMQTGWHIGGKDKEKALAFKRFIESQRETDREEFTPEENSLLQEMLKNLI